MVAKSKTDDDIRALIAEFRIFVENTSKSLEDHETRVRVLEGLVIKLDSKIDLEILKLKSDVLDIKTRTNIFAGLQVAFSSLVGGITAYLGMK